MVNVLNKGRVILNMDTDPPQAAEILTGHQLPSACLGNPKVVSAICQSSAVEEELYYDTGDEEDCSTVEDVSASSAEDNQEVKNDSSEEDDAPPVPQFLFPRRSRALKMLSEDFRILLADTLMQPISQEDAKRCLGKKRFKFVEETHPIPESLFMVDSKGFLILVWLTQGPGDEWLVDEQTRVKLKIVAGPVRNQWLHFLCWAYVDCDLISAARVLNGIDREFVPLSPMFLCRNVWPQRYRERCEAQKEHCCFGMDMEPGLAYAKLYGVPKERPDEVMFQCTVSENFNAGEEELYKLKEIYHYDTLESALQRLKRGYPIGAGLLLFDGWDTYYNVEVDDGMNIYEGPKPGKAYKDEHAVIIIDFRIIRGIKVAICKLSNGLKVANRGYIAVSLEVMVSMAGARKKYRSVECDYTPQYLLRDFYSVEVEMGLAPLVTVEPNEAESHEKFKVDISMLPHDLLAPTYRSPSSASRGLMMNAASKQFKTIQNEYEMTVDESSEVEEARDSNFVPIDTDLNQKELIDACGVVQSVSSTMSITRRNDHEVIPEKDMTKFQVLEINLVTFPKVADATANGMFSHYDWPRVAQLCEKAGLYIQALKLDIKRVIVNTHAIEPQALVEFLGTLSSDLAIECMKDLLLVNLRGNLQIIVQACKEYCEQRGVDACMKLFEQFKSYEGLYFFLGSYLSMSEDPDIHFKYIEAAAKTGQIKEVERVTRESNFYDAAKAKTCLMEAKLPDARPLINVCDRFGFVHDVTHYLHTNNMLRYIEGYVQKVNPGNAPLVVGQLIDDECPEDFIESLILSVRSLLHVEPLAEECEKRNRLCLLTQLLEHLVSEGSQDVHVHNALGKIIIDSNKNPEHCLPTNPY